MTDVMCTISMSVDGYVAGPGQGLELPLGAHAEERLHRWMFEDAAENAPELDAITNARSYIMGRNMFAPGRGAWDLEWKGWWGADPPYHAPVFVLTHHEREPLEMDGGTTFHFVTDGIEAALERAKAAAGDGYVSISGGAQTVNQYLRAGLIDELWLHVAPVLLGSGERLFDSVPLTDLEKIEGRDTRLSTHLRYRIRR
jgi:dihydrofolate reductase